MYGQWEPLDGPDGGYINDLKRNGDYVFIGVPSGLYRSADQGLTWEHKELEPFGSIAVLTLGVYDSLIIADGVDFSNRPFKRRLFRSTNNGITWDEVHRPEANFPFNILVSSGHVLMESFIQNEYIMYLSFDGGDNWSPIHEWTGSTSAPVVGNSTHAYKAYNGLLYCYSFQNSNLSLIPLPASIRAVSYLFADDDLIFLIESLDESLFRSIDQGETWTKISDDNWNGNDLICKKDGVYYAYHEGSMQSSENGGNSWEMESNMEKYPVRNIVVTDSAILAGTYYMGLFRSEDNGKTFSLSSEGIASTFCRNMEILNGQLLVSADYMGIYNYNLETSTWQTDYFPGLFTELIDDVIIFDDWIWALTANSIFRSNPDVLHWGTVPNPGVSYIGPEGRIIDQKLMIGGNRYFSSDNLCYTQNGWNVFLPYKIQINGQTIWPSIIARSDTYDFVSDGKQILRAAIHTNNWEVILPEFDVGFEGYARILNLYSIGGLLFAVYYNIDHSTGYLLVSNDHGVSWSSADDGLFGPDGIGPNSAHISNLIQVGSYLVGSTYDHGVYITGFEPIHWEPFNEGMINIDIKEVIFHRDYLYAATQGFGVYRRRKDEIQLTSVLHPNPSLYFTVSPNPANTFLSVDLENGSNTSHLTVWNLSGQVMTSIPIFSNLTEIIPTASWPQGNYVIHVYDQGKHFLQKVNIFH